MTKKETIEYWLKAAEMDLPISDKLFKSKDYVWSLYIGHLVLEKSLKALLVSVNDITPPKTHNLVKLAELTKLSFDNDVLNLLDEINEFNIEARYPDIKFNLYKKCNKEFSKYYYEKIRELFIWIKSMIIL